MQKESRQRIWGETNFRMYKNKGQFIEPMYNFPVLFLVSGIIRLLLHWFHNQLLHCFMIIHQLLPRCRLTNQSAKTFSQSPSLGPGLFGSAVDPKVAESQLEDNSGWEHSRLLLSSPMRVRILIFLPQTLSPVLHRNTTNDWWMSELKVSGADTVNVKILSDEQNVHSGWLDIALTPGEHCWKRNKGPN